MKTSVVSKNFCTDMIPSANVVIVKPLENKVLDCENPDEATGYPHRRSTTQDTFFTSRDMTIQHNAEKGTVDKIRLLGLYSIGLSKVGVRSILSRCVSSSRRIDPSTEMDSYVDGNVEYSCNSSCRFSPKIIAFLYNIISEALKRQWMKPSKLTSASYLANFYYVARNDPVKAYETCSEALADVDFFPVETLFPVIIRSSKKWVRMFDEHFQVIIGFIGLYRSMILTTRRNLTWMMNECPECFIRYIEIQCLWKLNERYSLKSALVEFIKHRELMRHLDGSYSAGHALLLTAALKSNSDLNEHLTNYEKHRELHY